MGRQCCWRWYFLLAYGCSSKPDIILQAGGGVEVCQRRVVPSSTAGQSESENDQQSCAATVAREPWKPGATLVPRECHVQSQGPWSEWRMRWRTQAETVQKARGGTDGMEVPKQVAAEGILCVMNHFESNVKYEATLCQWF